MENFEIIVLINYVHIMNICSYVVDIFWWNLYSVYLYNQFNDYYANVEKIYALTAGMS